MYRDYVAVLRYLKSLATDVQNAINQSLNQKGNGQ
jgi:hypothetical protein